MRSEVCRNQTLRRIYQMNIESERAAFEAWMVEVEGARIKPRFDRATAGPFAGDYRDGQIQGSWNVWQARAALSANHSEQVRLSEPDFYWVESDESSWNSPEDWAQDYYDYSGEKPESVTFSCAIELRDREYDSFEFDADGTCISCRLVNTEAAPSAGSHGGDV